METAVRWSANSTLTEQRFLIADVKERSFKRCKVKRYDGRSFKYETISTCSKVPGFRAFDWAPQDENLVAVGSWSGEVTVLSLDDTVANVSFPAKRQRLCNAVAFGKTGLLAAGLEGVRNDFCLNIWDINQRSPTVTSPGAGTSKPFVEPYRKFASSEAISSIKFFSKHPDLFISGIKGKGVRIYDLRERSGNPSLLFRTDCIYNIAVDPLDENYFACAGPPEDRTVQIWDARLGTPFSTAMTELGEDVGVQTEQPVLEYKDVFNPQKSSFKKFDGTGVMVSTIWSLRYCKGKSGCLGALASTGNFKVFETKHAFTPAVEQHSIMEHLDQDMQSTELPSMMTKRIHQVEPAYDDTRHSRTEKERIVAFDFTNLANNKGAPSAIILRGDHSVDIVKLDGPPPALAISSLGDTTVSRQAETTLQPAEQDAQDSFLSKTVNRTIVPEEDVTAQRLLALRNHQIKAVSTDANDKAIQQQDHLSSRQKHEKSTKPSDAKPKRTVMHGITLFTTTRSRCREGYLFNNAKNIEILRDDPGLQNLWKWIDCKRVRSLEMRMLMILRCKKDSHQRWLEHRDIRSQLFRSCQHMEERPGSAPCPSD